MKMENALCDRCPLRKIGLRHRRDVTRGHGGLVIDTLRPGQTLATGLNKLSYAFLRSGALKIETISPDGASHILGFLFSGDPVVVSHVEAPVVVTALVETKVCRLTPSAVLSRDEGAAEIIHAFCAAALEHAVADQHRMAQAHSGDAAMRLRHFLADIAERTGQGEVSLCMSRDDIARYLALRAESVSRAFASLEKRGYIERKSVRTVRVLAQRPQFELAATGSD